jgi:hypothetical protein
MADEMMTIEGSFSIFRGKVVQQQQTSQQVLCRFGPLFVLWML